MSVMKDLFISFDSFSFIGELFKLQMLTDTIMYDCIEYLLRDKTDEEALECLCRLLRTIGKELDIKANEKVSFFSLSVSSIDRSGTFSSSFSAGEQSESRETLSRIGSNYQRTQSFRSNSFYDSRFSGIASSKSMFLSVSRRFFIVRLGFVGRASC